MVNEPVLNRLKPDFNKPPPVWTLIAFALLLWGGEFCLRGLWEPDEARYAYVAREMQHEHNWLVMHINGEPYPDKPPLMFWMMNAFSLLFGGEINRVSARLPTLLGAILTLWSVTRLSARWGSAAASWKAILVLLTSFLFWQIGGWAKIDILLCGLVCMSVWHFFCSLERSRGKHELAAYSYAGLAMLAKGPVGLAIPMLILLATTLFADKEPTRLKRWHWVWGPLLACSMTGAWLGGAWLSGAPPEYFGMMIGEKTFGRVVESKGHAQPFHYFFWHVPLELLPWSLFIPAILAARPHTPAKKRTLAWIISVVGLFSLFVCKRNVYVLPAFPAAAILIATGWDALAGLSRRWKLGTSISAIVLLCILMLTGFAGPFVKQDAIPPMLFLFPATILLAGVILTIRETRQDALSQKWFYTFSGTFFAFQFVVGTFLLPAINDDKAPIEAAAIAKSLTDPDEAVYMFHQQLAIFPLYAHRPGREIETHEELVEVLTTKPGAVIVFHQSTWDELQPELGHFVKKAYPFEMGHKDLLMIQAR
jgi:4-amino-4-deoxy-L-arabinose transferase-like glycosyltransferase